MTYKMKGHSLPGPNQKKSPMEQAIELESDSTDSFITRRKKAKSRKNAINRSKDETAIEVEATNQAKLHAEQRRADRS